MLGEGSGLLTLPLPVPPCSGYLVCSLTAGFISVDIVPPPFRYENLKNQTNERSSLHLTVILRK